jgi:preprotein translocase subunit SecE
MAITAKIITFLKEVRIEMKKVNWLTREQLVNYTLTVIGFMLVTAIFFGALDWGFAALLQKFVLGQ